MKDLVNFWIMVRMPLIAIIAAAALVSLYTGSITGCGGYGC